MTKRIFLESKPVTLAGSQAGHMYLVLRDVIVDNTFRADDRVIRGTSVPTAGASLVTEERELAGSLDEYRTFPVDDQGNTQTETPQDRHSLDITGLLGAYGSVDAAWSLLQTLTLGINGQYKYELPGGEVHTANSNAVIFSILAALGVDIRDISINGAPYVDSFFAAGMPGGDSDHATLLATDTTNAIVASSGLHQDTIILGRDNVPDVIFGTRFADRIFGEAKVAYTTTIDTVSYESSSQGIVIERGTGTLASLLIGSAGDANGDQLYGIENLIGTDSADTIKMQEFAGAFSGRLDNIVQARGGDDVIDGGAGNDFLDGGADTDRALYADITGTVRIKSLDPSAVPDGLQPNGSAIDQLTFQRNGAQETDKLRDIERVTFSDGNERLLMDGELTIGNQGSLTIDGAGGIDVVDLSRATQGGKIGPDGVVLENFEVVVGSGFGDPLLSSGPKDSFHTAVGFTVTVSPMSKLIRSSPTCKGPSYVARVSEIKSAMLAGGTRSLARNTRCV
jgi:hypothetical protein